MPESEADRVKLLHGSLIYRDRRLEGFDAAAIVEVVEQPGPAPALGVRAVRLRVRQAGDGRAHDAQPGVQRDVGERGGRTLAASRSPVRVDPAGVSRLGRGHLGPVRLCGQDSAGRSGGRAVGVADADGRVHPHVRRGTTMANDARLQLAEVEQRVLRHRLGAAGHTPGPDHAGRPDRRRPELRQPRSGRASHGGRGGVRRHPARRGPESGLQGRLHPPALRLADLAELVYLSRGRARRIGGVGAGKAASPPVALRPVHPVGRAMGTSSDRRSGPLRAAGGRRAGAPVPQAERRHAVRADPLGVR